METLWDVAIVGGGPGGYAGALYCARGGLSALVIEPLGPGGQMALTGQIDNYPGFPEGVDGFDLGQRMRDGAHRFGAQTMSAQVTSLQLEGEVKTLETSAGTVRARCVMLATGAYPRELSIPGEQELRGRGVSYCATCDGMLYRGKAVAVVGGGNSAVTEALHLARVCKKVTLIHRRDVLTAARVYTDALAQAGVEIVWNSRVVALESEGGVLSVAQIEHVATKERQTLPCQGLFVAIGRVPDTGLVRGQVALDSGGYIPAGEDTKTDVPGVFAVGDARQKPLRQIVTAVADGAVAAQAAADYLAERGL